MPPTTIRALDMDMLDKVLGMESGYVLGFSDRTFGQFFRQEIGVDIDEDKYRANGNSKAKRLRCFLRGATSALQLKALEALWEYRQTMRRRHGDTAPPTPIEEEYIALMERLRAGRAPAPVTTGRNIDQTKARILQTKLLEVSRLDVQPRGFAFEKFLRGLFEVSGLAPRASFRLVGEQIDGSFEVGSDTYLLEAKWTSTQIGATDLHAFNGKVSQKAAWARGLFISYSGFSADGLTAFGNSKQIICMDGRDLHEILDSGLGFGEFVTRKARHAAETGQPFVRLADLPRTG